jgi:hypothetical protein
MKRWIALSMLVLPITAAPSLDGGYREMYNLDFAAAHRTFAEYQRLNPEDPMGPVSDAAAYLFHEFERLHILESEFFVHDQHFITDHKLTPDLETKRRFDEALEDARKLAARTPDTENSMFAMVLRSGLRSDYMALIEKRYVPSLREMKAGRQLAEKLLARNPNHADAWLAVGTENYMLSIKPAPLRFVLRLTGAQTDRDAGVAKLKLTAANGRFLAPFARMMLAVAALRENKRDEAAELLRGLAREYPRNPLYSQELARLATVEAKR